MMSRLIRMELRGVNLGLGIAGGTPAQQITNAFKTLSGLVGLWQMGNASPLIDSSGNGHTLAQNGAPTFGATARGGTYAVKAATDYWNAADDVWNSITGELFIAGYVKFSGNASAVEHIIAKWTATGSQRCMDLQRTATGLLLFEISTDGSATAKTVATATPITTNWVFVAARFIPSTSISVSIDTVRSTNSTTIYATIFDGSGAIELGSWNGGTAGMAGNQGVIGLYNVAPTDQQVTNLWNATKSLYPNP